MRDIVIYSLRIRCSIGMAQRAFIFCQPFLVVNIGSCELGPFIFEIGSIFQPKTITINCCDVCVYKCLAHFG